MRKLTGLLLLSTLTFTAPSFANGFGHQQDLSINGAPLQLADTSARVLVDNDKTALFLVDDIYDGLGEKKQPGYKVMSMSRTSTLLSEGKQNKEGKWVDDRMIHRGIKVLIGIPVNDGKMALSKAVLLSSAVISDQNRPEFDKEKDKVRPRGKKVVKKDDKISDVKFSLNTVSLPDIKSGEKNGGGIQYTVSYTVNGSEKVSAEIDSTFALFYVATPERNRGFGTEARFIKAQ